MEEKTNGDSDYPRRLRMSALEAIDTSDPTWLRKALHALAFVGEASDALIIQRLTEHSNKAVATDAKTSLFEFRRRHAE